MYIFVSYITRVKLRYIVPMQRFRVRIKSTYAPPRRIRHRDFKFHGAILSSIYFVRKYELAATFFTFPRIFHFDLEF